MCVFHLTTLKCSSPMARMWSFSTWRTAKRSISSREFSPMKSVEPVLVLKVRTWFLFSALILQLFQFQIRLMTDALDSGPRGLGSIPGQGTVLCSWARHFTLTVPLFIQVYKWVPANLLLGVTLWWTGIPSRGSRNALCRFILRKPSTSSGPNLWISLGPLWLVREISLVLGFRPPVKNRSKARRVFYRTAGNLGIRSEIQALFNQGLYISRKTACSWVWQPWQRQETMCEYCLFCPFHRYCLTAVAVIYWD